MDYEAPQHAAHKWSDFFTSRDIRWRFSGDEVGNYNAEEQSARQYHGERLYEPVDDAGEEQHAWFTAGSFQCGKIDRTILDKS